VNAGTFRRPESVLIVIYTEGGEFLLLERRRPPGFWQSVTGSLEWGEFADAAASLMNNRNPKEMGIRARAHAEKNLSWSTQAALLHSVFEKTLASKPVQI